MEIWRDICGYEGFYQVSNQGHIRSVDRVCNGVRVKGIAKNPSTNRDGYLFVNLRRNGKQRMLLVHRLVAQAFVDNKQRKPEINHIDGDKSNNNAKNLEWVTSMENIDHALNNGLIQSKAVIMDNRIQFTSIRQCAKFVGVDKSEIRKALHGKYRTVHGHTFAFA